MGKEWYVTIGAKTPKALVRAMDRVRKTKKISRSDFIREAIKEKILRIDPTAIDMVAYQTQTSQGGIKH